MKQFFYSALVFIGLLVMSGCSGGGGGSSAGFAYVNPGDTTESENQVLMGPLKDASIKIYTLDANSSIEETATDANGTFSVKLDKIPEDKLLLVVASGGFDTDTNDDGIADDVPTQNKGSLHAFATAKDLKEGRVNITLLSEIIYLYSKGYLEDFRKKLLTEDDFKKMTDAIALKLASNKDDLVKFNPIDKNETKKLKFNYEDLINGSNSVASLYHNDANESERLDAINSVLKGLDLYVDDSRLDSVKEDIKVSFVPSHIKFSTNNISLADGNTEVWVDRNATFSITIDEIDDGYKIIKWNGCDNVSTDLKVCTVDNIQSDRIIAPIAVPETIELKAGIVIRDLSNAYITIDSVSGTQKDITAYSDIKDKNTTQLLSDMQINDIIVHKTEPVFFGKLVEKTKVNDFRYQAKIEEVPLEEVLSKGYITTESLKTGVYASSAVNTPTIISRTLVLPDGKSISFDPSKPASITISFTKNKGKIYQTANKEAAVDISETYPITTKLGDATVEGKLTIQPSFNLDASWTFFGGLDQIYLSTGVTIEDNLTISTSKSWSFDKDIDISNFTFNQIVMVGPLPIVLSEPIKIYVGAKAEMAIDGKLGATAVISPTIQIGWSKSSGASSSITLSPTFKTLAQINGKVDAFAYLGVYPSFQIYGIGAGFDSKFGPYFNLEGSAESSSIDFEDSKIAAGLYGSYGLKYTGTFLLNSSWKFIDEALSSINEKIEDIATVEKLWIYKSISKDFEPVKIPGYIEVKGTVTSTETKTIDEDIAIMQEYTIQNKGETTVFWKASTTASDPFDASIDASGIHEASGSLEAGESKTISLAISAVGLDETDVGVHKISLNIYQSPTPFTPFTMSVPAFSAVFIENIIQEKLDTLPKTSLDANVTGSTVKRIKFAWDAKDEYKTKLDGYYIYKSDYNESSKECNAFSVFMNVDDAGISSYMSDDLLSLSSISGFKSIQPDKEYCFLLTGYKGKDEVTLSSNTAILTPITTTDDDTNTTSVKNAVEIMFVVDVSGSYGDDIETFKTQSENIINSIKGTLSEETTFKVGLTSFSDYPSVSDYDADYAYRLDQNLTTNVDSFKAAMDGLVVLYGGDGPESQLEAVYQTITSKDINWSENSIKFVFLFTDADFHDSDKESGYAGHGFTAVKQVIEANNISVIGFGSGWIPSDLQAISDFTFELSSSSEGVVEKIKTIIEAIPGSNVTIDESASIETTKATYIHESPSND